MATNKNDVFSRIEARIKRTIDTTDDRISGAVYDNFQLSMDLRGENEDEIEQWTQNPTLLQALEGSGLSRGILDVRPALSKFVGRGFTEGVRSPLTLFGMDQEGDERMTDNPTRLDETVARGIGSFAGMVLGYLPVSAGSGVVLKGAGVLRSAKLFQTGKSGVMKETFAGGLYDAGFSEDFSEVPKRFATGAVIGGFSEAAILQLAAKFRANKLSQTLDELGEAGAAEEALNITPGMSFDDIFSTFKHTDPKLNEADLFVLAAKMVDAGPHKQSIINGVKDPQLIVEGLKRSSLSDIAMDTFKREDGMFNVLLTNENARSFRYLTDKALKNSSKWGTIKKIQERKPLTDDEIADIIVGDNTVELNPNAVYKSVEWNKEKGGFEVVGRKGSEIDQSQTQLILQSFDSADEFVKRYNEKGVGTLGFQSGGDTTVGIAGNRGMGTANKIVLNKEAINETVKNGTFVPTLIHEYVHAISNLLRPIGTVPDARTASFKNIFELDDATWNAWKAMGVQENYVGRYTDSSGIVKELLDLNILAVTKQKGIKSGRAGFNDVKKLVAARENNSASPIFFGKRYMGEQTEVLSRGVEGYFNDPELARKLAPNAVELIENTILKYSPRLQKVLNGQSATSRTIKAIDNMIGLRVRKNVDDEFTQIMQEIPALNAKWRKAQWEKGNPGVTGMRIRDEAGTVFEYAGPGKKEGMSLVRTVDNELVEVATDSLVFPTLNRVSAKSAKVKGKIQKLIDGGLNWVAFNVKAADGFGFQRGFVEGIRKATKTESLEHFVEQNRELLKSYAASTGESIEGLSAKQATERILAAKGEDFIMIRDPDEAVRIMFRNADAAKKHFWYGDKFTAEFEMGLDRVWRTTDGTPMEIHLSSENVVDSVLREAGVPESLIPFYKENYSAVIRERIFDALDAPDLKSLKVSQSRYSQEAVSSVTTPEEMARSMSMQVEQTGDGRWRVESPDGVLVAEAGTEAEVRKFLRQYKGPALEESLDAHAPVSSTVMGGPSAQSGKYPKPYEQPNVYEAGWFDRLYHAVPFIGSAERFMLSSETLGLGPLWSKVYQPTQKAIKEIAFQTSEVARKAFGGKSVESELKVIEHMNNKLDPARRDIPSRVLEALSRQDVENGAGMARGMTAQELDIAKQLDDLVGKKAGKEQWAKLLSIHRMATLMKQNLPTFHTHIIPAMQRKQAKLSEVHKGILDAFSDIDPNNLPEDFLGEMLRRGGYTDAQIDAVKIIEKYRGYDPNEVSLGNIGRWFDAEFDRGVGRVKFIDEYDVTQEEIELAEEMRKVFAWGAEEAGLDPQRMVMGYFPHMRTTGRFGLDPEMHSEYMKGFSDITNEFIEYTRLGELEVYSRDPVRVTKQYVRAMMNKKHMSPVMEEIAEDVSRISARDARAGRILKDYLAEVRGMPTEGFQKLEDMLQSVFLNLGLNLPEDTGKRFVTALTSLSYAASIPFRAALVLRNMMQTVLMTPPRIGVEYYGKGLQLALEDGAYRKALKAGAIDPNTLPLAYGDETFRSQLGERIGEKYFNDSEAYQKFRTMRHKLKIDEAHQRVKDLFDIGFDFYRRPDDIGRSIAFYGQRARALDNIAAYRKGDISFADMLQKSKAKTYDEPVIEEFSRLIRAKQDEAAAEMLGVQLSKETHFRYGAANHPVGWGGVTGRLFGQFGTFPVQYVEYMVNGLRRGNFADRAQFLATHTAVNTAIVGGGAAVGMNLANWSTFPSIQYTGGPYADVSLNLIQLMSGSEAEKRMARMNLNMMLPTLESPQSISCREVILRQILQERFKTDFGADNLAEAAGFRFLDHEWDGDWFSAMFSGRMNRR